MFQELYSEHRPEVRGGRLRGRDIGRFSTARAKPKPLAAETSWSYFHPGRVDAIYAPSSFRSVVKAIDPQLDVVWHPIHQRWCVWVRNPHIRHWMCAGWQMLFPVRYADGSYMPLDDRTLATIYDRSPRKWGNAKRYFDRIQDEVRRDYVKGQQNREDLVGAIARDRWRFAQIKNIGHGSKFAAHHSGN